jgi:hypothetical protein
MYRYSVEVRHADNEVTRVYYDCLVRLSEKLTNVATAGNDINGGNASSLYTDEEYDGGSA